MALPNKLRAARLTNSSIANTIDDALGDAEKALCDILGLTIDYDYATVQMINVSQKAAANGIASLDASSKVVQHSAWEGIASGVATLDANVRVPDAQMPDPLDADTLNAKASTTTPTASKIVASLGTGKIDSGWLATGSGSGINADSVHGREPGSASGLATLDAGSKVEQDPANAVLIPEASHIPLADGAGKISSAWISQGIGSGFDADLCDGFNASQTPAINTIPVTNGSTGKIAGGFIAQGPGSGLDADTVDGATPAVVKTANAIVKADATGIIDEDWLPEGHGSGIDADMLEGKHASATAAADTIPISQPAVAKIHMDWLDYSTTGASGKLPVGMSNNALDPTWLKLPRCLVYHVSNIQILNNAWTVMSFVNEKFDPDNFHDIVTNTSRLTIPVGMGGTYLLMYSLTVTGTSNAGGYFHVRKNAAGSFTGGTGFPETLHKFICDNVNGYVDYFNLCIPIDLAESEYVELFGKVANWSLGNVDANPVYFGLTRIA